METPKSHPCNAKEMRIRFSKESDLPLIREVLAEELAGNPAEIRRWMVGIEANFSLMFSMLRDDELIGFAGLQYLSMSDVIFHSDCIRQAARGQGFGKAMFQARLASLDPDHAPYFGGVLALEKNIPFYQRLGFALLDKPAYDPALRFALAPMGMEIGADMIESAENELAAAGTNLCIDGGEESPDASPFQ